MSNVAAAAHAEPQAEPLPTNRQTWSALGIALAAGACAMIAPVLALAVLAGLGVRALTKANTLRVNLAAFLPPAIAALIVGAFVGLAGIIGVIFVWRVFEDCRWSIRAAAAPARETQSLPRAAHAYLTPLFGISVVAYTAPHMIAGLPLDLPHVPPWVPLIIGVLTIASVGDWMLRRAVDWRLGELARGPAAHMLAHHIIFLLAFGLTLDVSAGIVALVAWRLAHAAAAPQPNFTAVP